MCDRAPTGGSARSGSDAKSVVIVMLMMSASSSQGVLQLPRVFLQRRAIRRGRGERLGRRGAVRRSRSRGPYQKEVYKNTEHEIWSLTISAVDRSVEQPPGATHPGIMHWLRSLRMSKSGAEGQPNTTREAAVVLSGPGAASPSL